MRNNIDKDNKPLNGEHIKTVHYYSGVFMGSQEVRIAEYKVWYLNNKELTELEFKQYQRNRQFNDNINEALK